MVFRAAFTAIEISLSVAIIATLVSTTTIVTAPVLGRAAFNMTAERLTEGFRQAQRLAQQSDATATLYGIVIRYEHGRLEAMVTHGPTATSASALLDSAGQPRIRIDLGRNRLHVGDNEEAAVALAEGEEIGWLYRAHSGYPTVGIEPNLNPVYVGVSDDRLAADGVVGGRIHLGQHLSLRNADGQRRVAFAIYATGEAIILAAAE